MKITKKTAALFILALAAFGLTACQTSTPPAAPADEHAGHTRHVHADGSVHYH